MRIECCRYVALVEVKGDMDRWDEMRTAYAVARLGSVSGAAEELGIHRATVVRHIDALEEALGGRLFQRHARGYTPTEAGQDLLRVARATEEQFHDLAGRTKGRAAGISGELIVTSVEVVAPLIMPALHSFREQHPDTQVRFDVSGRLYRLEYGEAHIAVRAGDRPEHPDNVVSSFFVMRSGLYAHARYVARHGMPERPADYGEHAFIGDSRPLLGRWMKDLVPEPCVVFSSASQRVTMEALRAGVGIGFCPALLARREPELVEVHAPDEAWDVQFWLVTHVDLHRTPKVQAILRCLRGLPLDGD